MGNLWSRREWIHKLQHYQSNSDFNLSFGIIELHKRGAYEVITNSFLRLSSSRHLKADFLFIFLQKLT